jgi:cytoskeletal protein CcmA (bactofilin family)
MKKQFLILLIISFTALWIMGAAQIARASTLLPSGKLASGEVIDNDVFTSGPQVTIDGTVNGDVMVVGNQVQINGTVNGSLFVVGQKVVIQGQVSGTTYVAGVELLLASQAVLQRNLYFAGVTLTTQAGSSIQRDLNAICFNADLKGSVGRSTKATVGVMKVIELILNGLGGKFPALRSSTASGAAGSLASSLFMPLLQAPAQAGGIDTAQLGAWFRGWLRDFILLLVIGAVIYGLFRKPLSRTAQALRLRPVAGLGYGLLALLLTFNIFLAGILVASLIFVIGMWLGGLDVWSFVLAFWALAYAALSLFLAVLWVLVAYGTKLIVAYLVGSWLFEKLLSKRSVPGYVALAVGILIYVSLSSIPMLGWVLSVLVTAWGLGAAWLAYRKVEGTLPLQVAEAV